MIFGSKTKTNNKRLDGTTVIITGANTGLGKGTAQYLFKLGARVLLACRNEQKANLAIKEIQMNSLGSQVGYLQFVELDLTSFDSIKKCAEGILKSERQINILINNAGICCVPEGRTKDGFELHFGVNYLGHFLFTLLLMPMLMKSGHVRILNLSSIAHKFGTVNFEDLNYDRRSYSPIGAYEQSKLCNLLFTKALASKFLEHNIHNITVYAIHPGCISTNIFDNMDETYGFGTTFFIKLHFKIMGTSLKTGIKTIIYCALDDNAEKETGMYYNNSKRITPSRQAQNIDIAHRLWDISLNMCKINDNGLYLKS